MKIEEKAQQEVVEEVAHGQHMTRPTSNATFVKDLAIMLPNVAQNSKVEAKEKYVKDKSHEGRTLLLACRKYMVPRHGREQSHVCKKKYVRGAL